MHLRVGTTKPLLLSMLHVCLRLISIMTIGATVREQYTAEYPTISDSYEQVSGQ